MLNERLDLHHTDASFVDAACSFLLLACYICFPISTCTSRLSWYAWRRTRTRWTSDAAE